MARRLAIKRLSAVETRPDRSHQHEIHAGRLRQALGLPAGRTTGRLLLHIHTRDGQLVLGEDDYTVYDSRERNPTRAAEWRLYYATGEFSRYSGPGDLLVLYRPEGGNALQAVVAAAGSAVESRLLELLNLGKDFDFETFQIIEAPLPTPREAVEAGSDLTIWATDEAIVEPDTGYRHPIVGDAIDDGDVPTTLAMAAAAVDVLGHVSAGMNSDDYLSALLAAETSLYFQIEESVQRVRLGAIIQNEGSVAEVLDWAMAIHQSRRSRRGQSLQHHFRRLLENSALSYTAQCTTEPGETPDFVIPSCEAYHDAAYPTDRLRMVACKSTSRERWRQVLNEAARISPKHLLTLDAGLTDLTIGQMHQAALRPHAPRQVINNSYSHLPPDAGVGTVAELLEELTQAVA